MCIRDRSNGVGTIRNFLETLREKTQNLPQKVKKPKKVSWIVGKLVYKALIPTVEKLNLINGLTINLYGLPSIYWGQEQVVTGLLTGEDLIFGLKNKDLGDAIYIPSPKSLFCSPTIRSSPVRSPVTTCSCPQ